MRNIQAGKLAFLAGRGHTVNAAARTAGRDKGVEPIRMVLVGSSETIRSGMGNLLRGRRNIEIVASVDNSASAMEAMDGGAVDIVVTDMAIAAPAQFSWAETIRGGTPGGEHTLTVLSSLLHEPPAPDKRTTA